MTRSLLPRRALFAAIVIAVAAGLTALLAAVLAPLPAPSWLWQAWKIALLACFAGTSVWTGICVGNALPGLLIRLFAADPAATVFPALAAPATGPLPATVLALAVRDEALEPILPGLRRLRDELAAAGLDVEAWVLSDTADAAAGAAEARAAAAAGLRYRRRSDNAGFKAGNIMEFLDNHAGAAEAMVVLDADSEMSAAAVLRMLRALRADPSIAIVQQLTVGRPTDNAFPRLFQFGMRAGMRIWATGQGWWQGGEGPFWGHNAAIRIAPFRRHARLSPLPDGSAILSHDQVEAALLASAGWGVWVLAEEAGSSEENPPALPEFIRRDARWLAGNLQYRHLIFRPGLRLMARWQLAQAILLFAGAPLYLAFTLLAVAGVALLPPGGFAAGPAVALTLLWMLALYGPKLAGYAELLLRPDRAAPYGGRRRVAAGAAREFVFTLLLDPVMMVAKTRTMLTGTAGWATQNRTGRTVGWGEAAWLLWPQTLLGATLLAGCAPGGLALLWAVPLLGGLVLAMPIAVVTAHPAAGRWLARRGIGEVPEGQQIL
jgi:membrane glycosyltransferase